MPVSASVADDLDGLRPPLPSEAGRKVERDDEGMKVDDAAVYPALLWSSLERFEMELLERIMMPLPVSAALAEDGRRSLPPGIATWEDEGACACDGRTGGERSLSDPEEDEAWMGVIARSPLLSALVERCVRSGRG